MADRVALLRHGQIMQIGTPRQLYRAPQTRFVAEFLGETNLIEARRVSSDPGRVVFEVQAGQFTATPTTLTASSATNPSEDPENTDQYQTDNEHNLLSVRPEAIRLLPSSQGNTLPGTLLETTYLGETAQHLVEIKGCPPIKIAEMNPYSAGSSVHPEPGDRVWVEFGPNDIVPVADS